MIGTLIEILGLLLVVGVPSVIAVRRQRNQGWRARGLILPSPLSEKWERDDHSCPRRNCPGTKRWKIFTPDPAYHRNRRDAISVCCDCGLIEIDRIDVGRQPKYAAAIAAGKLEQAA